MTNFIEKFKELNSKDVSKHVEQKNKLNYLSWAYVQQELTKAILTTQKRLSSSLILMLQTRTCTYLT